MSREEMKDSLVQAWKEVFGVDTVEDSDDFFEVGGDSIKAVQLSSWLIQKGVKLELGSIFTQSTLGELAETLEETQPMYVPEALLTKDIARQEMGLGTPAQETAMPDPEKMKEIFRNLTPEQKAEMEKNFTKEQIDAFKKTMEEDKNAAPRQAMTPTQQQICTPTQQEPQAMTPAQQQICTPTQQAPQAMTPAQQQICTPTQQAPQAMTPAQQQICTPTQQAPQAMTPAQQQICTPMQQAPQAMTPAQQQICTPTQQQVCTPIQQPVCTPIQQPVCTPNLSMPMMPMPPMPPMQGNGQMAPPQLEKYLSKPVSQPISDPNVIKINKAKIAESAKSPEEALEIVMKGLLTNFSRQENIFDQGLSSLDVIKIVTRCGENGYVLEMKDIYAGPTFDEMVKKMHK